MTAVTARKGMRGVYMEFSLRNRPIKKAFVLMFIAIGGIGHLHQSRYPTPLTFAAACRNVAGSMFLNAAMGIAKAALKPARVNAWLMPIKRAAGRGRSSRLD